MSQPALPRAPPATETLPPLATTFGVAGLTPPQRNRNPAAEPQEQVGNRGQDGRRNQRGRKIKLPVTPPPPPRRSGLRPLARIQLWWGGPNGS